MNKLFRYLFKSQSSSCENHVDVTLRTRTYRLSNKDTWVHVLNLLEKMPGIVVEHEERSMGEITIVTRTKLGRTMDVTITIMSDTPTRTAIDIYSASRGSRGDLGANERVIRLLFAEFDRRLPKV